jgi:ABC-type methionine transport system ATPase subunit
MGEGLPANILDRLSKTPSHSSDEPLFHLAFRGHAAVEPLIAGLVKHCDVSVNILQAHLESIQGESCGTMTFALREADKEATVLTYLRDRQVTVEVLGYVSIA